MVAEALGAALTAVSVVALLLYRENARLKRSVDRVCEDRHDFAVRLAAAEADVTRVNGHNELLRKQVDEFKKDLRDATERIMTMKRAGFSSGMPKVEAEDRPELPSEIEGFLGRVRSGPAADQMREEALEAVRRGEEPSMILEKFRQGRPIWDTG